MTLKSNSALRMKRAAKFIQNATVRNIILNMKNAQVLFFSTNAGKAAGITRKSNSALRTKFIPDAAVQSMTPLMKNAKAEQWLTIQLLFFLRKPQA